MAIHPIEAIIEDFRAGKMVILVDDEDRENEGDILLAADACTPAAISFMAREAGRRTADVNNLAAGRPCGPLAQPVSVLLQGSPVFKRRVRNVRRLAKNNKAGRIV